MKNTDINWKEIGITFIVTLLACTGAVLLVQKLIPTVQKASSKKEDKKLEIVNLKIHKKIKMK